MLPGLRIGLIGLVFALLAAPAALAQDLAEAGLKLWRDNGCFNCHGTFGEGGEGGHFPAGPALRRAKLDNDTLRETIACGRPGTEMPSNLKGAYFAVACYGLPLGPPPAGTMGGVAMSPQELDALVEYVATRVMGKGAITKAECVAYYKDPNHGDCQGLR